jgi:hypothetical protein
MGKFVSTVNPRKYGSKYMKNAVHSWVHTLKDIWHLRRQMSHLSVQTKLDSLFRPASLRSEASTTSESSIDEWICCFYILTSWSWSLLEKPPIVQLLKNFLACYGFRKFITVLTRALHWSLSWTRSIQSIPLHTISLRSMLILPTHLRLGPHSSLWLSHQLVFK